MGMLIMLSPLTKQAVKSDSNLQIGLHDNSCKLPGQESS